MGIQSWLGKIKAFIPSAFMILISIFILSQALMIKNQNVSNIAGGSFFPTMISCLMLVTGGVSLISEIKRRGYSKEQFSSFRVKRIILFSVLTIGYVVVIPIISFYPATLGFLIANMYLLRDVTWWLNITVSLASILIFYLLFTKMFSIIFP